MPRTGQQYLESLQDNRNIYIDGERVDNVTTHSAFKGISQTVARMYDVVNEEPELMTYETEDGTRANKIYMIPRSREDLESRRKAITRWTEETYGLVGRSPDHVAGFFAGFASNPDVFARGGEQYKENLLNFYKYARDNDKFLSYVIIPPQIDRSKTASELDNEFLATGVYEEKEDGIIIRGSQMLGTSAAVSDYMFVSCITPLKEGDEKYALSFVVPMGAQGLKLYARPGYAMGKPSTFDYPLSTNFDETDALVVFDDVFIPWEHVFVYKNIELTKAQFFETPAHVLGNNQSQTRFVTKVKFAIGLAKKITEMNGTDKIPPVQGRLGDLASLAGTVEGFLLSSEYECYINEQGVAVPNPRFLYGIMGLQSTLYTDVLHIVRELAGGGVLQVPSTYKEFVNPETKEDMQKYIKTSNEDVSSEDKVKLFKLAWDLIGTEFGGRHQQYEMFYAGAPHVAKGHAYRNYGYQETVELVEKCLSSYSIPELEKQN
ncbi:4-hydroxyphenylacetate 3-hydroxylase family protein [Alteribacillus sp. YIM 98480]|uniref:4-hydroxyphenylacetate 3-hydroxylase family protein n=1 Tax=Alteribacillus sp. YIM 98480 TaxID=2606599 RepID=UPI00131C3CF2|nr:4-hydroxyphenylacetate 3-hydroxylase N-terminal domain-containing protein [Alteribacillus sp. YIM 98480]